MAFVLELFLIKQLEEDILNFPPFSFLKEIENIL